MDRLAEYRLNLTPFNYCQNNPLNLIDMFGLQDTVYLAEIVVVAYRSQENQPVLDYLSYYLWRLDRTIQDATTGNHDPYIVRNANFWDNWAIRNFDQSMVKEVGEWAGSDRVSGINNNKVRSTESYQGKTDDKEIQKKAGNNMKIIDQNIQYFRVLKRMDSIPVKPGRFPSDSNYYYIGTYKISKSTTNEDDTLWWEVNKIIDLYSIKNGDTSLVHKGR